MAKKYTGKRHRNQVLFRNRGELDYIAQVTLGAAAGGGAAVGEVLYACSRIEEGDLESWIDVWSAMAERVEGLGDKALEEGHTLSARGAYLRAFNYHRAATYCMRHSDPRLPERVRRFRACMQRAARLSDPPVEAIGIDVDGVSLPGYFSPAVRGPGRRPTLIFVMGGESFCEEALLFAAAETRQRGYNLFTFDLPGQGVTALQGMTYRADVEVPMSAAADFLAGRAEVDPQRIVAHGVSYGGYVVMRWAAHDPRVAAISASTPIIDFQEMMSEGWGFMARMPAFAGRAALRLLGSYDPLALVALEKFTLAAGLKEPSDILSVFAGWKADPGAIRCPVLCMVGEGETGAFQTQCHAAFEGLKSPKALRVFREEEGADGHCQANNLPLAFQVVFDWYAEVLA